ncbi:uncharacterized protein LOC128246942 isoform X5 [Mya arenaria]|uniref:uncharacterized protein LOC128246942 isoform X5 n=1 Tax=Mya arenaria TaxID=6604 RepID=UPI0022E4EB4E|nr:uncharacterized protein LOC128246942 isoform X5 [Mya arenaria]
MHKAYLPPSMATSSGTKCFKASSLDHCPKGHEMETCTLNGESGRYCKQCGDLTFQPNENRFGDQCRIRRTCDKYRMKFAEYGDKTRNAVCECDLGYHFENEDQRACVPNKDCGKGFGMGVYEDNTLTGICQNCFEKNMWSETINNYDRCKPLKNCEKMSRCTIVKSNGTFDNKCGPVVANVKDCDSIVHATAEPATATSTSTVVGLAVAGGVLCLLLVLLLVILFVRRRRRAARERQLRAEELEEMLPEIVKRAKKDENFCKKVLDLLQREVEDRINNQIWALAQELFKSHLEPAKYEDLLEKYRDQQHKYAVNGYLNDWRGWRGNQGDAVHELVTCLQSERVKRPDIVLEVVNKLREDFPEVVESYSPNKRSPRSSPAKRFCAAIFPCACKENDPDVYECKDTSKGLLSEHLNNDTKDNSHVTVNLAPGGPHDGNTGGGGGDVIISPEDAGGVYRKAATPSAPVIEDDVGIYPDVEVKGQHFYDRSDSLPVQASS